MDGKPLKQQSIDELYYNLTETKKELIKNVAVTVIFIVMSFYITSEKGVGFFTFLPAIAIYFLVSSCLKLKNIRDEIRSRLLHLRR